MDIYTSSANIIIFLVSFITGGLITGILITVYHRKHKDKKAEVVNKLLHKEVSMCLQAEKTIQAVIDATPQPFVLADIKGRISLVNQACLRLFSYQPEEMLGQELEMLVPDELKDKHRKMREERTSSFCTQKSFIRKEVQARDKNDHHIPIELLTSLIDTPDGQYLSCVMTDITERLFREEKILSQSARLKEMNAKLEELASIDALTGLKNRGTMDKMLGNILADAVLTGSSVSFIILDVDKFKVYNDKFGHPEGDLVLKEVASILTRHSRKSDIVCRYGGEEFAVILPTEDDKAARKYAERYRRHIEEYNWLHRPVTASFGISTLHEKMMPDKISQDEFIKDADLALYHSKENGRNRVTHFLDL